MDHGKSQYFCSLKSRNHTTGITRYTLLCDSSFGIMHIQPRRDLIEFHDDTSRENRPLCCCLVIIENGGASTRVQMSDPHNMCLENVKLKALITSLENQTQLPLSRISENRWPPGRWFTPPFSVDEVWVAGPLHFNSPMPILEISSSIGSKLFDYDRS